MKEFWLESFDKTNIYVTLWDDVAAPRGVVQLLHGMSEYAARYDEFAKALNKRGYIVFADDHRAHGRTEKEENLGRHKGDIFKDTVKDALHFREWLKEQYHLPVFLLGQSYGSFLGQAIAQEGTDLKAIALLGTGHMRAKFTLGSVLVAPIWLVARNWRPKVVNWVSDNMIKYRGDSGKLQWASSVPQMREPLLTQKYMHTDMSVNFDFCMMRATSRLYSKKALAKLNPATAIGLFCGSDDPVGNKGKGATKLHKMYMENGVNCELHLYEGARHEIFNDWCKEQVFEDVADFFDKFIIYEQTSIYDLV